MMRGSRRTFGLFLALLAIMGQLTLSRVVPHSIVSLAEATVLCQHDAAADTPLNASASSAGTPLVRTPLVGTPLGTAPGSPAHQSPDCLVCYFCFNGSGLAGLAASAPLLAVPTVALVARAVVWPPAAAPPPRVVLAPRPRGPPIPA